MSKARYCSPRLDEAIIAPLYHTAKARRIPMMRLASLTVRDGLAVLGGTGGSEVNVVRDAPPADDPRGRKN